MDEMEQSSYLHKLDLIADCPDEIFPEMLFSPMMTDFDDRYFKMDLDNIKNIAVTVDPRFTDSAIRDLATSVKTVEAYLVKKSLFEDYLAFILEKYGSIDAFETLNDQGELDVPYVNLRNPPRLRKKNLRRLIRNGIIPSFFPDIPQYDITERVLQVTQMEQQIDGPERDTDEPVVYFDKKISKKKMAYLRTVDLDARRRGRVAALVSGTSSGGRYGIGIDSDWVDCFYNNMARGVYDSSISRSGDELSVTAGMERYFRDESMSEEEKFIRDHELENRKRLIMSDSGLTHYGGMSADYNEYVRFMAQQGADLTLMGKKRAVKAVRAIYDEIGIERALTKKERKKLKKMQDAEEKGARRDATQSLLRQVLKTNKIMMNRPSARFGDTDIIRFEDGFNV